MIRFASEELGAEPYLRTILKDLYTKNGTLSTAPTEKGKKDLDVFHPSYKIKQIKMEPISNFLNDDRFIDIQKHVDAGLITLNIELSLEHKTNFHTFLSMHYLHPNADSPWNLMRQEVLKILIDRVLTNDIVNEVKIELQQAAELKVI